MDDVLLGIVLDRLDQQKLADEPTDLLLAALDGDNALASQLSAATGERYTPPKTATSTQNPVGAYSAPSPSGAFGVSALRPR